MGRAVTFYSYVKIEKAIWINVEVIISDLQSATKVKS